MQGPKARSLRALAFRAFGALTAPALLLAAAPAAYAQEASSQDIAQARQLGQQAQTAYDAGNYAESEKLWAAAAKLYPQAPTLTLGLARTQAKLGHFVGAQESYNKIIREWSNVAAPSPAFKDALEAAKSEVGAMASRIGHVVVTVEGPTNPQVTIDDQSVPTAALGLKRPVDPGTHVVKATAEGYLPGETSFAVTEGSTAEAKLVLEKAPEVAQAQTPASTTYGPSADTGSKSSTNKTLALVAFGVGGAGLVAGVVTGLIAMGKHGDLESACTGGVCPPSEQGAVDSFRTMGTISTIGFVVAGVGAAAGTVLLLTAPKSQATGAAPPRATRIAEAPRSTPVEVTPYLGLGGAGVTGRF